MTTYVNIHRKFCRKIKRYPTYAPETLSHIKCMQESSSEFPRDLLTWEKLSHVLIAIAVGSVPFIGYEISNFRESVDELKNVISELRIHVGQSQIKYDTLAQADLRMESKIDKLYDRVRALESAGNGRRN